MSTALKKTKGELTAERIMDAAERLFAAQGYRGTSLRDIAQVANIKEPGIYNHFQGKKGLYSAVLDRALAPMADAMAQHLANASNYKEYGELPMVMMDLLFAHPAMAALFQQALQGDQTSEDNVLINKWLERLFAQGKQTLEALGLSDELELEDIAIHIIAMFNLTTGYFLSQRVFATMADGDIKSPDNIARQKRLLGRIIRAMVLA